MILALSVLVFTLVHRSVVSFLSDISRQLKRYIPHSRHPNNFGETVLLRVTIECTKLGKFKSSKKQ